VIGTDQLAQIFRVETRRQRGRADQIAKHHGQLTPLGFAGGNSLREYGLGAGLRRSARQGRDSIEQSAAMPDRRDTEFAEILARQPPQNFPVDVVVAECGRVLFEPETAQPFGHIHTCRPETASLGPITSPALHSV